MHAGTTASTVRMRDCYMQSMCAFCAVRLQLCIPPAAVHTARCMCMYYNAAVELDMDLECGLGLLPDESARAAWPKHCS